MPTSSRSRSTRSHGSRTGCQPWRVRCLRSRPCSRSSAPWAIALERGAADAAEQHFAAALELARTLGDHTTEARCLNNLGIVANLRGDPRAALASYQLALAAYQQAGLVRGMAETQHNIGISRGDMGDYAGALAAAEEAARLAERVKDEGLSALALFGRGALHLSQGDTDLAAAAPGRAPRGCGRSRSTSGWARSRPPRGSRRSSPSPSPPPPPGRPPAPRPRTPPRSLRSCRPSCRGCPHRPRAPFEAGSPRTPPGPRPGPPVARRPLIPARASSPRRSRSSWSGLRARTNPRAHS